MISATNDGSDVPSPHAGQEAIVSEKAAAFLVRERAAEVIEVIEQSDPTD